jgi:hypothetical protein
MPRGNAAGVDRPGPSPGCHSRILVAVPAARFLYLHRDGDRALVPRPVAPTVAPDCIGTSRANESHPLDWGDALRAMPMTGQRRARSASVPRPKPERGGLPRCTDARAGACSLRSWSVESYDRRSGHSPSRTRSRSRIAAVTKPSAGSRSPEPARTTAPDSSASSRPGRSSVPPTRRRAAGPRHCPGGAPTRLARSPQQRTNVRSDNIEGDEFARRTRDEARKSTVNSGHPGHDGRRGRPERKRPMTRLFAWPSVVVGTGVDPVTFRFSGGRSAN